MLLKLWRSELDRSICCFFAGSQRDLDVQPPDLWRSCWKRDALPEKPTLTGPPELVSVGPQPSGKLRGRLSSPGLVLCQLPISLPGAAHYDAARASTDTRISGP